MISKLEIGTTPHEEDCAQTGATPEWESLQRLECQAFMAAIRKVYGPEPDGAQLKIQTSPHDFGSYREVVCTYDTENAAASAYAFKVDDEGVATWAQAGMWAPVTYGDRGAPRTILRDPATWSREANPQALPALPV